MHKLKNHYGVWTEEQAEALRRYWEAGICPYRIAQVIGKTAAACRGKAVSMGIYTPAKRGPKAREIKQPVLRPEPPPITLAGPVWSVPEGCQHVGRVA